MRAVAITDILRGAHSEVKREILGFAKQINGVSLRSGLTLTAETGPISQKIFSAELASSPLPVAPLSISLEEARRRPSQGWEGTCWLSTCVGRTKIKVRWQVKLIEAALGGNHDIRLSIPDLCEGRRAVWGGISHKSRVIIPSYQVRCRAGAWSYE